MTSTDTNTIQITVNRNAGTIHVEDPTGTENGTIRILEDGAGWTRTNLQGERLAMYDPNRDSLINRAVEGLTSTSRPVNITEA